jgi:hypothetical protein
MERELLREYVNEDERIILKQTVGKYVIKMYVEVNYLWIGSNASFGIGRR